MATPRVLLVHGAATTSRVWDRVHELLRDDGVEVVAPDRASTGDLAAELEALADDADGAVVVGVSGGATLGLALASDQLLAGAVLHEPAGARANEEAFRTGLTGGPVHKGLTSIHAAVVVEPAANSEVQVGHLVEHVHEPGPRHMVVRDVLSHQLRGRRVDSTPRHVLHPTRCTPR